jgi:hypothetical protein
MSIKETLTQVVQSLSEKRAAEVLDFAQFILQRQEEDDWRAFGQRQFARAYGDDEPEYTEADIKSRE